MANAAESNKDKACIFVYLHGGISHIDFTHPGINVPQEYRSVKGVVDTSHGFSLAGSFISLAKKSEHLRVVRSFSHRDANHSTAAGWVNTGHTMAGTAEGGALKEPAYGAIISKMLGSSNSIGIPTYVKTGKIDFGARRDGSAWLGSSNIGFDVDDDGIRNLKLGVDKARGDRRMELVESFDRSDDPLHRAWTGLRKQAYNIAMGKASEAFDLTKEPIENQQKFKLGKSDFGKSLLMAVRTVERGSKFVTVVNGGWDMHNDIEMGFTNKGEELDWGLSLLVDELIARGLFDSTLIVVTTEFGRTPRINSNAGRDHWNSLVPLMFIGGGHQGGLCIGEADSKNEAPKGKVYTPNDLCCSILSHFEINPRTKVIDNLNRPRYFVEENYTDLLKV
jgi:hypothetical protein